MTVEDRSNRIAIGADHGGFRLKEHLKARLATRGYPVDDCGTFDEQKADYPRIAAEVARRVSDGRCSRGIVIDGAGIGSAMTANKLPGVRAALCYDVSSARNSREHNDANVLTLGAGLIGEGLAEQIVDVWLSTDCTEERHKKRVAMIGEIERSGSPPMADPAVVEKSATEPNPENADMPFDFKDLSKEDIDRIAARIAEMGGAGAFPVACACCGPNCNGHCAGKDPATVRQLMDIGAGRIGHGLGGGPVAGDVAGSIDHTLLKPEATASQVEQLCKEAREHGFASVCVNPSYVKAAARALQGSSVPVCTVVGFPLGAHVPEIKAMEARRAIREGAGEIDMSYRVGITSNSPYWSK